jgi:pyruvate dehydrogenase E2 component (dihydrolipoamide acetyltransferase)
MFRIQLARLGQTMEQGTLVRWLKREGDTFRIGEDIYEIETEKALVTVQATQLGCLAKIVAAAGSVLPVGALLAVAAEEGELPNDEDIARLIVSPANGKSIEAALPDAGQGGSSSARIATATAGKFIAVPKARALARELGVDLGTVVGTGEDGTILPEDVGRAVSGPAVLATAELSAAAQVSRVPLNAVARSMISAVERGWQTPQFTQTALVDASQLVHRKQAAGPGISYTDLFLDALLSAAKAVPEAVCSLHGDEVWRHTEINVTIAVATDHGLYAPVLRDAGQLTAGERAAGWRSLVQRARHGKLSPKDVSNGIIALSNLGVRRT